MNRNLQEFKYSYGILKEQSVIRTMIKDNVIKDYYGRWSIERKCDSVILQSSHPLRPPASSISSLINEHFFYTHECKNNEIAYFKVDVNLIARSDRTYLGLVLKNYEFQWKSL